jgi:hypothetical protein
MSLQLDFTRTSTQTMLHGDCLDVMKTMPDNSIDFIITDPPYGISFLGKGWDHKIPSSEYWKDMLRICKPGSMMACAGFPRMIHRLGYIIEDSGWILRDMIMHLFGSGFPKSHNHFGLEGYGTSLKPAWEGWLLCMKPLDGTYAQNVQKWGLGGINIYESRIGNDIIKTNAKEKGSSFTTIGNGEGYNGCTESKHKGRWPSNLLLDESATQLLDQQSGIKASRFFYCPKASSSERNKGLDNIKLEKDLLKHNGRHPTVKPIALMKYIITLLAPPNNPTLLDPFAGSGTTLLAAKHLDINAIGIEKEEEYYNISKTRIENG